MALDESDVTEDMGMFEAALHARPVQLELPRVDVVLLVPDGSNQDPTARALASAAAARTGARLEERGGLRSAADILRAAAELRAGLLVVPVPFGSDLGELRDESLGAVVDLLLLEAPCPLLCARQLLTDAEAQTALADALLPVHLVDGACARAASWALRIVARGGRLELLGLADQDTLDEARPLLGGALAAGALDRAALGRAVSAEAGGLIAAVQHQGAAEDIGIRVEIKVGRAGALLLEEANQRPRLCVVGTPQHHAAPAFHRAVDLLLGARGPVLIVFS